MPTPTPAFKHGAILDSREDAASLDDPRCVTEFDVNARDYGTGIKAHEFLESDRTLRTKVKLLAQMLRASEATLTYSGAGISTAAGIDDYATKAKQRSLTAAGRPVVKDWKLARPTLTHYALACLHRENLMHHWINQNHDSLPQKAGFPQHCLNEIHGSLHDIANSIVPYEGTLREDLFKWMEEWTDKAQLCLCLGTSLSGFTADNSAVSIGQRYFDAAGIDKHLGHGLVIVNLQETQYDSLAALRIYAKTDVVFEMLMEELGLKAELNSARKEIYHLPSWCKKEEEDVFQVPFDPTTGLLSSNKLTGPEKSMRWDLRIGARVRLTGGPYEGDEGVIIAKSAEGHYKVRFSESIHPIFNVRRRTFCLWLGCWWIETVLLGHGIVPGGKIPFINAPRKAEDKLTRRQREGKASHNPGPATKWVLKGNTWQKVRAGEEES